MKNKKEQETQSSKNNVGIKGIYSKSGEKSQSKPQPR
jgi:hypothetical protein